jgi:hypothetical protein
MAPIQMSGSATSVTSWRVAGSYFEACNCDAICPCRRQGGQKLTTGSTYGVCQFALSWAIVEGRRGEVDLAGLRVVLAGFYRDDEPGKPWTVCLYVDERATADQHDAVEAIFLGRLGGTPAANFARSIADVTAVRRAAIDVDHRPGRWFMRAADFVTVRASAVVPSLVGGVTCGIPGHDQPGDEVRADVMRVEDDGLHWHVLGRCGFASSFDYVSET